MRLLLIFAFLIFVPVLYGQVFVSYSTSSPITGGCTGESSVSWYGQTYSTIIIGTQTWFKENLNVASASSRCYNDLESNCDTYGALYEFWDALGVTPEWSYQTTDLDGTQGICPTGWRIPSQTDFTTLRTYLGGDVAGGKMKSTDSGDWTSGGSGSNSSCFMGKPGGGWNGNTSVYESLHDATHYLTTTIIDNYSGHTTIHSWELNYTSDDFISLAPVYGYMYNGLSIRCIKN